MGVKLNKSVFQMREYRSRSQKRELYLLKVRQIDSMNPTEKTFHHLIYKDFLIRKIIRIEELMGIEPTVVI